jgi:hypothetical protein
MDRRTRGQPIRLAAYTELTALRKDDFDRFAAFVRFDAH